MMNLDHQIKFQNSQVFFFYFYSEYFTDKNWVTGLSTPRITNFEKGDVLEKGIWR